MILLFGPGDFGRPSNCYVIAYVALGLKSLETHALDDHGELLCWALKILSTGGHQADPLHYTMIAIGRLERMTCIVLMSLYSPVPFTRSQRIKVTLHVTKIKVLVGRNSFAKRILCRRYFSKLFLVGQQCYCQLQSISTYLENLVC